MHAPQQVWPLFTERRDLFRLASLNLHCVSCQEKSGDDDTGRPLTCSGLITLPSRIPTTVIHYQIRDLTAHGKASAYISFNIFSISTNLSTSLSTSRVESAQETDPADTDPDTSEDVIVHQRNVAAG